MNTSRASCCRVSSPTSYVAWPRCCVTDENLTCRVGEAERGCHGFEQESSGRNVYTAIDRGMQLTVPQEINVQNMNVELVAQMFKNYQSNVLFHLEGS